MSTSPNQRERFRALAFAYHQSVHAAKKAAVDSEGEAQLTGPVSTLLSEIASLAKLGDLRLIRETRLKFTRPDFAALLTRGGKTYQKGYVELKAPDYSVNVTIWTGHNARKWDKMKNEAEIIIVCNGREAQLYFEGEAVGDAAQLPYDNPGQWDGTDLIHLLEGFFELTPTPVVNVTELSKRLAIRTADLRDRLLWLLEQEGPAAAATKGGYRAWCQHVYLHASERDFADGISQVIAYGMVLAVLSTDRTTLDRDGDGHITVAEARAAIRSLSPVLAAAFAPLVDKPPLAEAVQVELGALETLVSAINVDRVNRSADHRGDPWLYFYEDFLSVYDPEERRQAGVYYTPIDVVEAMVNISDHLLVGRLGKRNGFADPAVVTLDPAAGTGTFPLAILDKAAARANSSRGPAGPAQAAANLARTLLAFELLPGPYSVAHLRLTQRLAALSGGHVGAGRVVLTDTLESPLDPNDQLALFGDAEVLAAEQNRAKRIKLDQRVTVVIGNPPYRRVERELEGRGSGGWVINGRVPGRRSTKSLFDDVLDVARANTNFAHHASLYNLYVYFWRWGIWKAFEAHGDGPGIVAFITASSWLSGPGFIGLRQLVREKCDEAWIIDLGGDNRGTAPDENVFAIETPVAVVILVRDGASDRRTPANVHYREIVGTADEKLRAMRTIASSDDPLAGDWRSAPTGWHDRFVPTTGDAAWEALPKLTDIFPWQQPGCKFGRTWPIAPSAQVLEQRWERFVSAPREQKSDLFVTGSSGRNVLTKVEGLSRLVDTKAGDPSMPIVRYGYRSFDRQWAFQDPRMAKTDSPSLWQSLSEKQVFLCSLLTGRVSSGPSLVASAWVPDLHHFRGNFGGKDVIPLYRDREASLPNLTKGLARFVGEKLGQQPPTVEDFAAYTYALLASSAYQARFAEALRTPGLRVPLTADLSLWTEAVAAGREMLWLHTYGERYMNSAEGRGTQLPILAGFGWQ